MHFSDRLENMLEEHLVSFSKRLHNHLIDYEERLNNASQYRCDMAECQILNEMGPCMSEVIPPAESQFLNKMSPCMSEVIPAEPATQKKPALKEPQATSCRGRPSPIDTEVEMPQTASHTATPQGLITSPKEAVTWQDHEEKKKQRARRRSIECNPDAIYSDSVCHFVRLFGHGVHFVQRKDRQCIDSGGSEVAKLFWIPCKLPFDGVHGN